MTHAVKRTRCERRAWAYWAVQRARGVGRERKRKARQCKKSHQCNRVKSAVCLCVGVGHLAARARTFEGAARMLRRREEWRSGERETGSQKGGDKKFVSQGTAPAAADAALPLALAAAAQQAREAVLRHALPVPDRRARAAVAGRAARARERRVTAGAGAVLGALERRAAWFVWAQRMFCSEG